MNTLEADEKGKGKKSEAVKEVKDKSQQDFDKLTKGKAKLYESDPSNVEQFAESFAIYKADPDFLKMKNSSLYDWFNKNRHLKWIK